MCQIDLKTDFDLSSETNLVGIVFAQSFYTSVFLGLRAKVSWLFFQNVISTGPGKQFEDIFLQKIRSFSSSNCEQIILTGIGAFSKPISTCPEEHFDERFL